MANELQVMAPSEKEIKVSLPNSQDIAKVIKILVNMDAQVLEVQKEQHTLKDVYFSIVPKENREI